MSSTNNIDKVKTYLLAASGRRTIRNNQWIDDVPSESFTLPKYEVSKIFYSIKMLLVFCINLYGYYIYQMFLDYDLIMLC